jgi:uncharacterized protein (DUF924 family)/acyl-CoA thioesterase FadM
VLKLHHRVTGADVRRHLPFTVRRRLHWSDADAAQIGYTGRFIDIALEAGEFWLEDVCGTSWFGMRRRGVGSPMVKAEVEFTAPIRPGERMDIEIAIDRLGSSSLTWSARGFRDDLDIFTARFTSVLLNLETGRPTPYPDDWRAQIAGYQRECALVAQGHRGLQAVLDHWFVPEDHPEHGITRPMWFGFDSNGDRLDKDAFDAEIRAKFLATHEAARRGDLDHWALSRHGALALLVTLDQFPRHLYRGTAEAFAADAKAREMARKIIAEGWHTELPRPLAIWLYLPFEHSEDLVDQELSMRLFQRFFGPDDVKGRTEFAVRRHHEIIERFGRFPHRNQALGRASTPEEIAFLREPNSSF